MIRPAVRCEQATHADKARERVVVRGSGQALGQLHGPAHWGSSAFKALLAKAG